MPDIRIRYRFSSTPWRYAGQSGWVFVTLPGKLSREIRKTFRPDEAGWGRLSVIANIRNTEWKTAIWFDTKANAYLLPLKASIRAKEDIRTGERIAVTLIL